jgi:hypothetical protein
MTRRSSVWTFVVALLLSSLPAMAQWNQRSDPYSPNSNYIPEGTRFIVRLKDKLETKKLKPGKKFTAELAEDLVAPNGVTIPRGKKIRGHVSEIDRGTHARLLLSFNEIETPHGKMPLAATVTDVPGEHSIKQPNAEGEIERKGVSKGRAIKSAAAGAGVGALAGAVTGGMRGAVIGAAAGTAVGLGAGILTDRDLRLEKGQQLELRLDRPVQVPER